MYTKAMRYQRQGEPRIVTVFCSETTHPEEYVIQNVQPARLMERKGSQPDLMEDWLPGSFAGEFN